MNTPVMHIPRRGSAVLAAIFAVLLVLSWAGMAAAHEEEFEVRLAPVNALIAATLRGVGADRAEGADLSFRRRAAREAAALDLALDAFLATLGAPPAANPQDRERLTTALRETIQPTEEALRGLSGQMGLSLDNVVDVATLRLIVLWSLAGAGELDPAEMLAVAPELRTRVARAATSGVIDLPRDSAGRQMLADLTMLAIAMDMLVNTNLQGRPRQRALEDRFAAVAGQPRRSVDLHALPDSSPSADDATGAPAAIGATDAEFAGVWVRMSHTGTAFTFHPRMLFSDDTVTRDVGLPPDSFDIASSRVENPGDWGTGRQEGDAFVKRFPDDNREYRFGIPGQMFEARPAPRDLRLEGRYMSLSSLSVPLMGGTQVTAAWQSFEFSRDGRFVNASGASTSAPGMGGYALPPDQRGRYHIDGHAITFHFDDGREERRLFYLIPESTSGELGSIGIGAAVYVQR